MPLSAMQGALRAVVDRHEILRTCFVERGGEILQAVLPVGHPDAAPRMRKRALPPGSRPGDLEQLVDKQATQPYQLLSTVPPVRFTLLALAPGDAVLVVAMHHIIRRAEALCLIGLALAPSQCSRLRDDKPIAMRHTTQPAPKVQLAGHYTRSPKRSICNS